MKNNLRVVFSVLSPLLLVLGDVGLFFSQTMFAGYVLIAFGCVLGLINFASDETFGTTERFHLLTLIATLLMVGLFVFSGIIKNIVIGAVVLFIVDFLIHVIDARNRINSKDEESYEAHNEKEVYDELENIREEFDHVKILEEGVIEDFSLKRQAEKLKEELKSALVLEDPKEGRYFYTEGGKMFHVAGCMAMRKTNKKEIKSSNSRTELLAKGYKSCKICNS
ncbi:MAG: hypothetical protein ACP5N3_03465 [Candidatus Nanoarchaeia archaeon]